MRKEKRKKLNRELRKRRTRAKIFGTKEKPRLSVFRSNRYTYAQLIDDAASHTLLTESTKKLSKDKQGTKVNQAEQLGQKLAETAKKAGVKTAVFDRGNYRYHGRVKALAEGAKKGGLKL